MDYVRVDGGVIQLCLLKRRDATKVLVHEVKLAGKVVRGMRCHHRFAVHLNRLWERDEMQTSSIAVSLVSINYDKLGF